MPASFVSKPASSSRSFGYHTSRSSYSGPTRIKIVLLVSDMRPPKAANPVPGMPASSRQATGGSQAQTNVDLRPTDHAIDADERQLAEEDVRARLAATAEDKNHVALRRQERASPGGEVASTRNVDRTRNEALREISGGAGIQNRCGALAECRR